MKKINCIIIFFLIIISCITISIANTIPFETIEIEKDYEAIQRANLFIDIIGKLISVIQVFCAILFIISIIKCVYSFIKKDLKKGLKYIIVGSCCIMMFFGVGVFNIIKH